MVNAAHGRDSADNAKREFGIVKPGEITSSRSSKKCSERSGKVLQFKNEKPLFQGGFFVG